MSGETNTWEGALAGASLTGALVAVVYGLMRLIRRSRCASHTRCCDIDVARSQEGQGNDVILQVMQELQLAAKERNAKQEELPSGIKKPAEAGEI